jgi:flavin reductase (DIM6/NTAB) family NADH-FMN oxidoreductase RutF
MTNYSTIDNAGSFWRALGARAVGAAIVTARGSAGPSGFLALSATHLSADPPMMMVSIGLTTSALSAVREGKHFAINYLAKGDEEVANEFGGKGQLKGADRFTTRSWSTIVSGAPTLDSAVGVLDCGLEEMIERHGAVIAIGRVLGYRSEAGREPLISFAGGYR